MILTSAEGQRVRSAGKAHGERNRTSTFGPVTVALANHGTYEAAYCGDNFGFAWRAARLYFPLEGELHFSGNPVGARGAALAAGWHPFLLACRQGAQVLEVDIAAERFEERDLLLPLKFVTWPADSCLPSATAAALGELLDRPASSAAIRNETSRVVQALIGSLLHVALVHKETQSAAGTHSSGVPALGAAQPDVPPSAPAKPGRSDIAAYIARKHTNAAVTPATIAAHFNISLRTLYRCFDGDIAGGEGVSGELSRVRTATALQKLSDSRLAGYSLDEVAEMCGYRSALALRRAVWAATGQTPSQIRAQSV